MSKQERWAVVAILILSAILFGVLLIMFVMPVSGQSCYPGFSPTPQDPDCDGIISIDTQLSVITMQGTDGLFYLQCLSNCVIFYTVAPIDILYTGYESSILAIETWRELYNAFYGYPFIPVATPS